MVASASQTLWLSISVPWLGTFLGCFMSSYAASARYVNTLSTFIGGSSLPGRPTLTR